MLLRHGIPMCKTLDWEGHKLKVIRILDDEDYGEIWDTYLDHSHTYLIYHPDGLQIVEEQDLIDELDNRSWIPVKERGLDFEYYDDFD